MSVNELFDLFGVPADFDQPVDFNPGAFWNDTPLLGIKVNEEWIPLISGVLKRLTEENVYLQGDNSIRQSYAQAFDEIITSWRELCEAPCIDGLTVDSFFAPYSWSNTDSVPILSPGEVLATWVDGLPPTVSYLPLVAPNADFEHITIHVRGTAPSMSIRGFYKADYSYCGPHVYQLVIQTVSGGALHVGVTQCDDTFISGDIFSVMDLARLGYAGPVGLKQIDILADTNFDVYILHGNADCVSA